MFVIICIVIPNIEARFPCFYRENSLPFRVYTVCYALIQLNAISIYYTPTIFDLLEDYWKKTLPSANEDNKKNIFSIRIIWRNIIINMFVLKNLINYLLVIYC